MNKPNTTPEIATAAKTMRIAKAIARSGVCSRRAAEDLITSGRITVNGKKIESPALNVSEKDTILLDGTPLPKAEPVKLWRYHKPKGLVTTARDEKNRETIFDHLPKDMPRTITIGRLDINTEGLLLLTNDGELARHLELPSTGWLRRYKVRAAGSITQDQLDTLKKGLTIDGVKYGPVEGRLIKNQGANCWYTLALREGKNREVKKLSEHLGLKVNRLIRLSFGPFMLGDLEKGAVEDIKPQILIDQLGPAKAAELGLLNEPSQPKSTAKSKGKRTGKKPEKKTGHFQKNDKAQTAPLGNPKARPKKSFKASKNEAPKRPAFKAGAQSKRAR